MGIRKTFQCRQHSEDNCLRLFHTQNMQITWVSDTHAWMLLLVSDTHTQLFPLSRACLCVVKSLQNISSRSCHCALWSVLWSQGSRLSMLPGGGKFCKKLKYVLAKENTACYGSIISVFTSISIYTSNSVSMLSRNLCKTWQHGFIVEIGEVYACQRPTHTSFFRHACMLIPIRKRNTRACLTVWWNLFYFNERRL